MPLPKSFDQNELFLIITLSITITFMSILPRRFPLSISILLCMFASTVARICDHILAGQTLDLYDVMDTNKYELFDFISYFLYIPFAYFFVYFYDKWKIKGFYLFLYIVICSIGGVAFEWLSHYFHVIEYKWWKLYYSLPVYLIVQPATLIFYEFINKAKKSTVLVE